MVKVVQEDVLERFHDSLERCQSNPEFLGLFYDRLQHYSDDIQKLFESADLERIKRMIQQSLILLMMATEGSIHSHQRLKRLREQHTAIGVQPEHYTTWLETLLSVVEELDPKYNLAIDQAWRTVLGEGINIMTSS